MKILFIIPDYGSFNNFLAELAIRLKSIGNQVHVICSREKIIDFEDKYDYKTVGIEFHYIDYPRNLNPFSHLKCSRKINQIMEQLKPDVVDIHFARGILTTVLAKKPEFYTAGTFHGLSFPMVGKWGPGLLFHFIEHFSFKRLDEIWVLNKSDYNIISKKYPGKAHLLQSYGLGCDLERFQPSKFSLDHKRSLKALLNIGEDDFVLTYTGRFVNFKGFNKVLQAFEQLQQPGIKGVKLIMIGGYDSLHPTGISKTKEDELKNSANIILTGFTNEIEKYLSITDLFVFPSTKEGMPVCIMEALAMGVPVLTSNTRGCNDLILDGYNGYLTSAKPTVNELVNKIKFLMNNKTVLSGFAENALKDRNKLSRNHYINEQIEILNRQSK